MTPHLAFIFGVIEHRLNRLKAFIREMLRHVPPLAFASRHAIRGIRHPTGTGGRHRVVVCADLILHAVEKCGLPAVILRIKHLRHLLWRDILGLIHHPG